VQIGEEEVALDVGHLNARATHSITRRADDGRTTGNLVEAATRDGIEDRRIDVDAGPTRRGAHRVVGEAGDGQRTGPGLLAVEGGARRGQAVVVEGQPQGARALEADV